MVFLAENVALGRRVAIKVLLPQIAANREVLERFRQEARAAAAIGHPNIVDVLDLDRTEEGAEFIVMEHLRGETLGQLLERQGPLPLPLTLQIVYPLLDALEAAHEHGIIHRDLKPDNIFLVREPVFAVKILDFGISKLTGQREQVVHTATGAVIGTPIYMSPEQAYAERDISPAADLYALGAMLYEMLGGQPPFRSSGWARLLLQIVSEAPQPLAERRADLPADLCALVMQLLAKAPQDRPPSAADVRARLGPRPTVEQQAVTPSPSDTNAGLAETLPPLPEVAASTDAAVAETLPPMPDEVACEPPGSVPAVTIDGPLPDESTFGEPPVRPLLWLGVAALIAVAAGLGGYALTRPASQPALDGHVPIRDARPAPDLRRVPDLAGPDAGRTPDLAPPRSPAKVRPRRPPRPRPPDAASKTPVIDPNRPLGLPKGPVFGD